MSVRQGMNVGAVRESARVLSQQASEVDSLVSQATRSIAALENAWRGDDFAGFHGRWQSSGAPALGTLADELRRVSRELSQQADAQSRVSAEGGHGDGGTGGSPTSGPSGPSGPSGEQSTEGKKDWIDPSHSKASGNPYDPDNQRTSMPDGSTMITDDRGNTWYEDSAGNLYPPGTAVRLDEHGNPVGVDYGGHSSSGDGPGSQESMTRVYSERDGWERRDGFTHEWSREHDTAYTRWKADPERPWNDESNPRYGLWSAPGGLNDGVERIEDGAASRGVDLDVSGEVKNDLWERKGAEEASVSLAHKQWGSGENQLTVAAGEARAEAEGSVGVGPTGAAAAGSAGLGLYASRAGAQFQTGSWNGMSASGQGTAYVGAEAKVGGEASIGPGGAKVGVNAEAFAGAKAESELSGKVGPAEVTAGGELSVGVGAHADVDAEISMDNVEVSVDVGATLGIGGGVKFDVSFSPKEVLDVLPDLF
ncbi:hypothetical protein GCM10022199_01640 [Marihabitans asiaticum]|uniref:Uncharacterized protein YukE n=1 Tax=Marihabitans asiaticum TaxID=415218 RepID=A0A560WG98_9MICO|nr:WXG100 family type VII secretion target [Marihabitans asiaticum]TWD16560.1 uncharacterized protein YukE [Marihabitans asiaticum]